MDFRDLYKLQPMGLNHLVGCGWVDGVFGWGRARGKGRKPAFRKGVHAIHPVLARPFLLLVPVQQPEPCHVISAVSFSLDH